MPAYPNRRTFLKSAALGSAWLGFGNTSFLSQLPVVSAAEAELDPKLVQFRPEIEPLVRLLEETPRESLIEAVATAVKNGASYQEVLAALLLAGVRNVQPRPAVGFKFHAVLVVNSAHLASLASPDSDRWLPIFWAIDYYKKSQLDEQRASGWKMPPLDDSRVPSAVQMKAAFTESMDKWDTEASDAAIASLARNAGQGEVFEMLYRYGARDFRDIGHKAIFVANSQRTLSAIGWRYAEPVLRSLSMALANHHGDPLPSENDNTADRPWRRNEELEKKVRAEWLDGKLDDQATRDLIVTLRGNSADDACDQAVEMLNRGVSPQSIWDAVLVGSGEVLMRQPGIVGLHALTTANALHYAYQASGVDGTRKMMLLQGCAFAPMFREAAKGRGRLADTNIDQLQPADMENTTELAALEEIFADVSSDRMKAASKVQAYVQDERTAKQFIDQARHLLGIKGNDAHDYKFSSAVLEDYYHVSPAWRKQFLALSVFNLCGSQDADNKLIQRTRAALA